jgi:uncharacterized membrane protein YdjX (TVP38/TMEM64 family)
MMFNDYSNKTDKEKTSKTPLIVSIAILMVLVASYFIFPTFKNAINEAFRVLTSDDKESIKVWVSQFGMIGPIVLILAMVAQMFMFVVPNVLLMVIAIISYGPVWGGIISLLGVFLSSSLGYVIGRYLGPVTINKLISVKTQQKISQFIEDYGVGAIVITRLTSLSNDSLSFVAGILKMTYHKYILATLSGITPLIVLLALYGENGKIEKALIYMAGLSLILLVIYIIIDRRRKNRRNRTLSNDSLKLVHLPIFFLFLL